MTNEYDNNCCDRNCNCEVDDQCCDSHADDIEVIELEDENGETEEFVIFEEIDFENRHFVIVAPLAEVQAQSDTENAQDLDIDILEMKGDDFTVLDDEDFAKRLLAHLDEVSVDLAKEETNCVK
jgi:hypothetical protein